MDAVDDGLHADGDMVIGDGTIRSSPRTRVSRRRPWRSPAARSTSSPMTTASTSPAVRTPPAPEVSAAATSSRRTRLLGRRHRRHHHHRRPGRRLRLQRLRHHVRRHADGARPHRQRQRRDRRERNVRDLGRHPRGRGSSGMAEAPDASSAQGWVSVTFNGSVAAGTTVELVSDGVTVASYTAEKTFGSVVFSTAERSSAAPSTRWWWTASPWARSRRPARRRHWWRRSAGLTGGASRPGEWRA